MPDRLELQYWDSSLFIAWLSNHPQNVSAEDMEGVRALVRMAMAGQSRIITSQITFAEVLEGKMTPEAYGTFEKFLKKRNAGAVAAHLAVMRLAGNIRSHYVDLKSHGANLKVLKAPDATHLATAIIHKVDVFYTLDSSDFVWLDGDVAGYRLNIKVPPAPPQKTFDFPPTSTNS